jgi:hypothetical protein
MPDDRTVGLLQRWLGSRRKNSVTPHGLCQERFPSSDDFTYPLQTAGGLWPRLDSSPTPKLNLGGKNDPHRVCFPLVNLQHPVWLPRPPLPRGASQSSGSKLAENLLRMHCSHHRSPENWTISFSGRVAVPNR